MENKTKHRKTKLNIKNVKLDKHTLTFDKTCIVNKCQCGSCNGVGVIYNISGMIEDNKKYTIFKKGCIKFVYCKCWNDDYEVYPEICIYDGNNLKIKEDENPSIKLHLNENTNDNKEREFIDNLINNSKKIFGKNNVFIEHVKSAEILAC